MSITRFHQFSNDVKYARGGGCLVCGSNVGPCIDLGVDHRGYGVVALCDNHAREAGLFAGLKDPEVAQDLLDRAQESLTEAIETKNLANAESNSASQDREVIERLLSRYRPENAFWATDKLAETPEELGVGGK